MGSLVSLPCPGPKEVVVTSTSPSPALPAESTLTSDLRPFASEAKPLEHAFTFTFTFAFTFAFTFTNPLEHTRREGRLS